MKGRTPGRGAAWVVGLSVLGAAAEADAQEPTTSIAAMEAPGDKQLGGELEMAVAARREVVQGSQTAAQPNGPRETASLSPMLRMDLRVRDEIELLASFGMVTVFTNGPQGQSSSARPSNIAFGGRRVWEWASADPESPAGGRYRAADVGLQFAIPTGSAQTDQEIDAFEYALAGRGGLGPWEWMPNTLSFVVPGSVRAQVSRRWVLDGRGAIAGMFPSLGDVDPPTVAVQAVAGARWVLPWLALGIQASGAYNGRREGDRTQTAIAPSLDTNLCRRSGRRVSGSIAQTSAQCPVSLRAQFHFNLDAPYGFGREDALAIWGLYFGLAWAAF